MLDFDEGLAGSLKTLVWEGHCKLYMKKGTKRTYYNPPSARRGRKALKLSFNNISYHYIMWVQVAYYDTTRICKHLDNIINH